MLHPGSVSRWIDLYRNGNRDAAQPLWERYHKRIVGLARSFLRQSPESFVDEEDVAQEAFNSFFSALEDGRFPQLSDRNDLWRLLVVITRRKYIDQIRKSRRQGADSNPAKKVATFSLSDAELEAVFQEIVSDEPTPALAAQLVEEYERLLESLEDPKLQEIAQWKLQAFNNEQIAQKLGCSRRTVIRKLDTIRLIWKDVSKL